MVGRFTFSAAQVGNQPKKGPCQEEISRHCYSPSFVIVEQPYSQRAPSSPGDSHRVVATALHIKNIVNTLGG